MSGSLQALVHADPWAKELVDLPSLNAKASGAIESAISWVQKTAHHEPEALRGRSMVVLGPAGAGKTHLFGRLRRSVGRKAVFVHVRPLIGSDMTPRYLLRQVVEQLGYESQGLRQIDGLVGSLLAYTQGVSVHLPQAFLHELESLTESERDSRLENVLEMVIAMWPQADEVYLRRVLRCPFVDIPTKRALLAWLSGRELDDVQLGRLGVRECLRDDLVLPALRTLGAVAAPAAPIVIVFDQLENLVDPDGMNRVRAYGNLVAELVDGVRGVIVVQLALDTEWASAIEPALATSQRTRLSMNRETLSLPTDQEREALLRMWAARLPEPHAEFPLPFGADQVDRWCSEPGMTPRMLLIAALRSTQEAGADAPADETAEREAQAESLARTWEQKLAMGRGLIDEATAGGRCVDADAVVDGVVTVLRFVPGARVVEVLPQAAAQLVVERQGARSHVSVMTKPHPRAVAAQLDALARLADRETVVAMRQRSQDFPPTWKVCLDKRQQLLQSDRVTWLDLEREELAKLLALRVLWADARSRDVTDHEGRPLDVQVVRSWVDSHLQPTQWPVVIGLLEKQAPARRRVSEAKSTSTPPLRASCEGNDCALQVLRRLRVASVDRLVREVLRVDASQSRATVIAALRKAQANVRWFRDTIVAVQEDGR